MVLLSVWMIWGRKAAQQAGREEVALMRVCGWDFWASFQGEEVWHGWGYQLTWMLT